MNGVTFLTNAWNGADATNIIISGYVSNLYTLKLPSASFHTTFHVQEFVGGGICGGILAVAIFWTVFALKRNRWLFWRDK